MDLQFVLLSILIVKVVIIIREEVFLKMDEIRPGGGGVSKNILIQLEKGGGGGSKINKSISIY